MNKSDIYCSSSGLLLVSIGEIKTFSNFILGIPENVNPSEYNAVVVWCETFGEFITAAKYQ